ncbi:hypothetical protein HYALB_00009188 [Hymenoscyphus albidus]|uniref:Uncharacterized protein n=1 Tax=Hymenoscyphus albidus TaxID=595503 RepID=A0A9N9LRL3_9HELO|nr:hypothetical protein HYALB_00009188 [Hymenoscyphus albidus]
MTSTPPPTTYTTLREQWTTPTDILSVLLIVGADVVKTALAQFNGQYFKPVPFSFGWVAYAYSYLLTTVGGLKSMPEAEFKCLLINCSTGKIWDRTSWLLGRILDCYEDVWMPEDVRLTVEARDRERQEMFARWDADVEGGVKAKRPKILGFAVAVFRPEETSKQGVPSRDNVVFASIATTFVQLGIAAVPCGLYREWEILVITAVGTLLAWLMGVLQERSTSNRRNTKKTFILTKGPGYGHAIVILGTGDGLDLDDMANEVSFRESKMRYRISIAVDLLLVILWTALLITTSGMKSNTWYLVGIGGIGMLQNIFIAGARRHPSAYGLHLRYERVITESKVMNTLMKLEEEYPNVGRHLLPILFPGPLRPSEAEWWARAEDREGETMLKGVENAKSARVKKVDFKSIPEREKRSFF